MCHHPKTTFGIVLIGFVVAGLAACSTAYYSTWEMLGQEKRDLLRSTRRNAFSKGSPRG